MNKPMDNSLRQALAWWESLREERFVFEHEGHTLVWNVGKAWQILEERHRAMDFIRPHEQGVTVEQLRRRYPTLDWEYAKTTDLSKPLLFVPYQGKAQLIDGFHRLAKAVLEGVVELPAYLLSQEEADECLIMHLLPGQEKGGSL